MQTLQKQITYKSQVLPGFYGFYGSIYESMADDTEREALEEASEELGFEVDEKYLETDRHQIYLDISKQAVCEVNELMGDFAEFEYDKLKSPQYYNFTNDEIICNVTPKIEVIKEYIYKHRDLFTQYLKDRFTSRDGFHSFTSNNFAEWEGLTSNFTKYSNDKAENIDIVLSFIFENEELELDITDHVWGICLEHTYVDKDRASFENIDSVLSDIYLMDLGYNGTIEYLKNNTFNEVFEKRKDDIILRLQAHCYIWENDSVSFARYFRDYLDF